MFILTILITVLLIIASLIGKVIPEDSILAWIALVGLFMVSMMHPLLELFTWLERRNKR
jgi:hypothetical protein